MQLERRQRTGMRHMACTQGLIMISFAKSVFSTGKEQGKKHHPPQSTRAPSVVWSWKRANGTLEQLMQLG